MTHSSHSPSNLALIHDFLPFLYINGPTAHCHPSIYPPPPPFVAPPICETIYESVLTYISLATCLPPQSLKRQRCTQCRNCGQHCYIFTIAPNVWKIMKCNFPQLSPFSFSTFLHRSACFIQQPPHTHICMHAYVHMYT